MVGGGWAVTSKSDQAREAVLRALAAFPEELARALNGASPEELMRPGSDGGWGAVEILPHLRDWEAIFVDRAQAIVEQDRPFLQAFDDELWPIERDYRSQDPHEVFDEFQELRTRLVGFLRHQPPEVWDRIGEHGVHGPITLQWMAENIRDHDQEHLTQVRDALA